MSLIKELQQKALNNSLKLNRRKKLISAEYDFRFYVISRKQDGTCASAFFTQKTATGWLLNNAEGIYGLV